MIPIRPSLEQVVPYPEPVQHAYLRRSPPVRKGVTEEVAKPSDFAKALKC